MVGYALCAFTIKEIVCPNCDTNAEEKIMRFHNGLPAGKHTHNCWQRLKADYHQNKH